MLTAAQMDQEFKKSGSKSIMKRAGSKKNTKKSISFGACTVHEYDKSPMDNSIAKKIDSKDISDMRDEKTKAKAYL